LFSEPRYSPAVLRIGLVRASLRGARAPECIPGGRSIILASRQKSYRL
jgi:hypothetical protein